MLIITGAGRCGTSFITAFCKAMGADVGEGRWMDGINAGLEDPEIVSINNKILNQVVKNREFDAREIRKRILQVKIPIAKDPRFFIHPLVLNTWIKARQDIRVLHLTRKPEQIVASSRDNPEMTAPNYRNHVDLIIQKEMDFAKTIKRLNIPAATMVFPEYLNNPREAIQLLNKLSPHPFHMTPSVNTWNELVDQSKVHHGSI